MSTPVFGRVLTAMVSPMKQDGSLDLDVAARLATYLVDQGNEGLVVNGTTGESSTTTDEEKSQLIEVVLDAVGDRAHIVAGVGTNDTSHTIHLAREAAARGAHGQLVVTPYYNKPPQAGLLAHFRAVADATDLPVMLYDIPGRSGVPIATETLIALAEHPRIVAVKDAKSDFWASTHVMRAADLTWYSGNDGETLPHMAQGAVGVVGVTTHAAPARFAELVAAAAAGDFAAARSVHIDLVPAVDAVMGITQGAMAAKAALVEQGVLSCATVRSPLVEMSDDELTRLRAGLKESGLL
ncbi:4-hydroxy-tetrahydrodipicolinate synthase [Mobilicoccus caccae]|nr:4-hydroxy-tetrahydrodipicolinate synthase [Mobilicoccus caccae]